MNQAEFVHIYSQVGIFPNQSAGRSGVVQVNMGQQQRIERVEILPAVAQTRAQRFQRGRRPGVNQHARTFRFDEYGGDRARPSSPIQINGRNRCHIASSLPINLHMSGAPNFRLRSKDLLAESWGLGLGYWHRALSLFCRPAPSTVQTVRENRKLLLRGSKTKLELRRLPLRSSYRVNAVKSGKSYDEFMEEVYVQVVCSNCCGGALGASTL